MARDISAKVLVNYKNGSHCKASENKIERRKRRKKKTDKSINLSCLNFNVKMFKDGY